VPRAVFPGPSAYSFAAVRLCVAPLCSTWTFDFIRCRFCACALRCSGRDGPSTKRGACLLWNAFCRCIPALAATLATRKTRAGATGSYHARRTPATTSWRGTPAQTLETATYAAARATALYRPTLYALPFAPRPFVRVVPAMLCSLAFLPLPPLVSMPPAEVRADWDSFCGVCGAFHPTMY